MRTSYFKVFIKWLSIKDHEYQKAAVDWFSEKLSEIEREAKEMIDHPDGQQKPTEAAIAQRRKNLYKKHFKIKKDKK